jgi:TonB family protein
MKKVFLFTLLLSTCALGAQQSSSNTSEKVYDLPWDIQKMPSFPGGEKALMAFISENMQYPATACEKNKEGTVALTFTVKKDGSLADFKMLKDIGYGLGDEAIRICKAMPKWVPGEANGNAVNVKFSLPIRFRIYTDDTTKYAIAQVHTLPTPPLGDSIAGLENQLAKTVKWTKNQKKEHGGKYTQVSFLLSNAGISGPVTVDAEAFPSAGAKVTTALQQIKGNWKPAGRNCAPVAVKVVLKVMVPRK